MSANENDFQPAIESDGLPRDAQSPGRLRGNGFLSVGGNLFVPGLGHMLAGQARRGTLWLMAALLTTTGLAIVCRAGYLAVLIPIALADVTIRISSIIDGFWVARRSGRSFVSRAWMRFCVGIASLVLAAVVHWPLHFANSFVLPYVEAFSVSSEAMAPALLPGDRILVVKRVDPQRWSIVVFRNREYGSDLPYVSRVAGLPGEKLELQDGNLDVNGRMISRPPGVAAYSSVRKLGGKRPAVRGDSGNGCKDNPILLGPDEYFLLSDNSARAMDGRYWELPVGTHQVGALPIESIIGVAKGVYWPPARWRFFE